jgi:hypothetical protein
VLAQPAHGPADFVERVRLEAHPAAVAGGGRHRHAGHQQARADEQPAVQRAADRHGHQAAAAAVAGGGDAAAQRGLRVVDGADEQRVGVLALEALDVLARRGAAAQGQVQVGVDQPGQQGPLATVNQLGAGGRLPVAHRRLDGRDPPSLERHGDVPARRGAGAVDQATDQQCARPVGTISHRALPA